MNQLNGSNAERAWHCLATCKSSQVWLTVVYVCTSVHRPAFSRPPAEIWILGQLAYQLLLTRWVLHTYYHLWSPSWPSSPVGWPPTPTWPPSMRCCAWTTITPCFAGPAVDLGSARSCATNWPLYISGSSPSPWCCGPGPAGPWSASLSVQRSHSDVCVLVCLPVVVTALMSPASCQLSPQSLGWCSQAGYYGSRQLSRTIDVARPAFMTTTTTPVR